MMNGPTNNSPASACKCAGCAKVLAGRKCSRALISRSSPAKFLSSWGRAAAAKAFCSSISSAWKSRTPGEILINGESIHTPEIAAKYRMALVFQSGALLNSLTVGENVGLYLTEHRLKSPEEIDAHRRRKTGGRRAEGRRGQNARRTFRRHEKARRHRPRAGH